jgi:lipoprotein LprG
VPATEDRPIVPPRAAGPVAAALALTAALAACGSSSTTDPHALLLQAKRTIDATPAVHFVLSSSGAGGSGTIITGGAGDAHRPDQFRGTLNVMQSGFAVTVNILSTGGRFLVKLPFTAQYQATDPASYGFGDPATLLDPDKGLSTLLVNPLSAGDAGRDRFNGEELDEVDVTLPGDRVAALLTSADKSKPVKGRIGVDVDNHQIRRVVLTGPFFQAGVDSTFTLVLDSYGENVSITPPA